MRGGTQWWRLCAWVVLLPMAALRPAHADTALEVRQTWQLLDYVAVDYGGAVKDSVVSNAAEYREMREFAARAAERIAQLPVREGTKALIASTAQLQTAIAERAPAPEVARFAHLAADQLLSIYPVPAAPSVAPDLARGAALYESECLACHGAEGHGDGPAARSLDPPPVAFTDAVRARERSVFSLYQTISQGVAGTSMTAFASLSDADRWALAFYVGGLSYSPDLRQKGERLWKEDEGLRAQFANLETLSRTSEATLALELGANRSRALLAYLRANPVAIGHDGLGLARARLTESLQAYESGDGAQAGRLALSAYLDGFEPLEPQLRARDAQLLGRIESAMAEYRARINRGVPASQVAAQAAELRNLFETTTAVLGKSQGDASSAFIGSFTIFVREGLEALLIVIAIIAFLVKAGRRDVLPYVHSGWLGALGVGILTWGAATFLVGISGAGRELTEGLSSLLAAVVLLSVGLWMHQKSLAGRWQRYINEQLARALDARSAWFLAGLAFVAVYREVFETILFYAALWKQGNGAAILAGLAAGSATLAVIAVLLLRYSARLPIAKFFSVSSLFIAVLAVVLTGKGVAALQEAGLLQMRPIGMPEVPVLGIYPSMQTLLAQLAVVIVAVAGHLYNVHSGRKQEISK